MTPFYQDKFTTIYCCDYIEYIKTIEPKNIGTVITDPPFNAGKEFDNDNLTDTDFMAFCNRFALALYQLQPRNILVEVGKDDTIMRDELKRYFKFEYSICLNYTNSMRNGKVGYSNWGLVLWFSNNGKVYKRYKDRLDSAVHNTKNKFTHPSPKEITHYSHLIRMFAVPDMPILDPFMGSGTTLLSAKKLGIHAIGCDTSHNYCNIAKNRLIELNTIEL